ncbi:hypothetical protein [Algoriphagus terrigena]|uniref:hypothetical protein n=1 Tax=Algoriphagus terrigena TaxID=344884 RepID=UPI00047D55F7|nr:hypothetical protein [Algoriphagus terrigena]
MIPYFFKAAFFLAIPGDIKSPFNKNYYPVVSFLALEVLPVNEQAMENPNASELVKKLAKGQISRTEFDLFLKMLDDKKQAESLDEGFWKLFAQFLESRRAADSNDENP